MIKRKNLNRTSEQIEKEKKERDQKWEKVMLGPKRRIKQYLNKLSDNDAKVFLIKMLIREFK